MDLAFLFCLALVALALEHPIGESGGPRARRNLRLGHAHYLVGDSVRLMLKGVVSPSNRELRLYDTPQGRCAERGASSKAIRSVRRKYRNFSEIPRCDGCCHSGGRAPRVRLL